MKVLLISFLYALLLFFSTNIFAQCIEDITLHTQAEVDAFVSDYGCDVIEGNLTIGVNFGGGNDINNLEPLISITSIEGDLTISYNEDLINLNGLQNLTSIGGSLLIYHNFNLTDLGGLENLTIIGENLGISYNFSLSSIEALQNITTLDGYLIIEDIDNLTNLTGLQNISSVGGYLDIKNNANLSNLAEFQNLTFIGGDLEITDNVNLTNIVDLQNLTFVGGDIIVSGVNLSSLSGLENLTMVNGELNISETNITDFSGIENITAVTGDVNITYNDSLINLNGLEGLMTVEGALQIAWNTNLNSLLGLQNIEHIGYDLWIVFNPSLETCCAVLPVLNSVAGFTNIFDNHPQCSSPFSASVSCGVYPVLFSKVFLEGCYANNQTMDTNLNNWLPLSQPFNIAPYNYQGSESLESIPTDMVDWVLVEVRTGTPNLGGTAGTTVLESKAGILLSNGEIAGTDGTLGLRFESLEEGQSYHFAIRHLNHLDVLTANPIMAELEMQYDFSLSPEMAFGNEQQKLSSDGTPLLFSGDANGDGIILNTDYDLWFVNNAVLNTYSPTDWNLDGTIQVTDYDLWFVNKAKVGNIEIQY